MTTDNLRHAQYGSDGVQIDDPQHLVGLTNSQTQFLASGGGNGPSPGKTIVLGDSLTAFGSRGASPASVTAVGKTVTINLVSHGESVGNVGVLHLCNEVEYNGVWPVVSVIDADNFTVTVPVAPTVSPATGSTSWLVTRSTNSRSYWGWADFLLGGALDIAVNAGIGSNTTTMMLARLQTDVVAYKPSVCIVMGGTNDIRYAGTSAARDLAWFNLKQIYDTLTASGVLVLACTVLPIGSGDAGFATSTPLILSLNDKIKTYAAQKAGMVLADTFSAIVDNTSADSRALASTLADTVHINAVGAFLVGQVVAGALSKWVAQNRPLISSNSDAYAITTQSTNRLSNPLMISNGGTLGLGATSSGGGTTGIALIWNVTCTGSATAVCSLVARTVAADGDTLGNNQRVVMTSTANAETVVLKTNQSINSFVSGENIAPDFALRVNSATNVSALVVNLLCGTTGVSYGCFYWNGMAGSDGFPSAQAPFQGVVRLRDFKFPVGISLTSAVLSVTATFSGVGAMSIDVGRARVGARIAL